MIEVKNINKSYGELQVLKNLSLDIAKGEIVSIVGASGAGKTTLLQIIGSLDKADSGHVMIGGESLDDMKEKTLAEFRSKSVGFVFQFHQLLPEFSAMENVMMPALIAGVKPIEAKKKAEELLEYMGLRFRADHKPSELSGGEKQRVAVARALMNKPKILLADEPSGSLDTANKTELHKLFFDLRDKFGLTILIVTHDEGLAQMSDRIIKMKDGEIIGN